MYPGAMNTALVCSLCATPYGKPYRAPAPELSPDLDLRPGEPTRGTLAHWVQTCPGCGAVAPDLTQVPAESIEIIESEAYLSLSARPPEATPFLRWAMICRPGDRAGAYIQAAWAADDANDDEAAQHYRREAAAHWGEPDGTESALRLIDILRRANLLAAAEECAALVAEGAPDDNAMRILAYQRARIAERDTGRHLLSSALRPPARMPHVAHRQATAKKGFFARLFGR
jgi:hypothetical protein